MNDYDLKACESVETIRDKEFKKRVEDKLVAGESLEETRKMLNEVVSKSSADSAIFTEAAEILMDVEKVLKDRSFKICSATFSKTDGVIVFEVNKD